MTTTEVDAPAAPKARPSRPPPTLFAVGGGVVFVLVTLVTSTDWAYGVGFNPLRIPGEFLDSNPAMVEGFFNITDAQWREDYVNFLRAAYTSPESPIGLSFDSRLGQATLETIQMAFIATIVGALIALPLAVLNSQIGAPNRATYLVVNTILNVVRSIPDVIWAALFVVLVSTGALAGVLALTFFTIGVVGKLTADIVDGIDQGPVEAAHAAGASHATMLRTAVVPQLLSGYASFSLYALELNLRGSAVLGFVGAGGIGERLRTYYSGFDFEQVSAVILVFFIIVFGVERCSIAIRKRLV